MRSRTLLATSTRRRLGSALAAVVSPAVVLIVWEIAIPAFGIREYLLPRPSRIAATCLALARPLAFDAAATGVEAGIGLLAGGVLAWTFALAVFVSRTVETMFYPWAIALKTTPLLAIAPLLTIWLGSDATTKIVLSAITCFFPVLVASLRGFRSTDQSIVDALRVCGASRLALLWKVHIPWALPYLFSGLRVAAPLSVIGAIVGEFFGAEVGLGLRIMLASNRFETTEMFAGVFLVGVLSWFLFGLVVAAEHVFVRWRRDMPFDI